MKTKILFFLLMGYLNVYAQQITQIEYFFDTDPGLGLGYQLTEFNASNTIDNLTFDAPINTLQAGFHYLFVRAKDQNGKWSMVKTHTFLKEQIRQIPLPNIAQIEYFIDTDPGLGLATAITGFMSASSIPDLTFTIPVETLSQGIHQLQIRAKDQNGKWSIVKTHSFLKENINAASLPNIVKIEYFIDTDPGLGLATAVTGFTSATEITDYLFDVILPSQPEGIHTLFVRAKDSNNKWSLLKTTEFNIATCSPITISPCVVPCEVNPTIINICTGQSTILYATGCIGTVTWSTGLVGTQLTVSTTGTYTALCSNFDCGSSISNEITVNINPVPTITVTTPSAQCGGTINLNTAFSSNGTLTYFTESGFSSSASNPVTSSGTYYAQAGIGSCTSTASVAITIHVLPTVTIQSNTPQCAGQTINLTASGGTSYSWACPGGNCPNGFVSNNATPSFVGSVSNSGTYTVTATNFNGCTATQTTSVSVHPLPTITVQSNSPQCAGQTINLTASGGTSYSWACPGGNCPNGFVSNSATPSFVGSASNSGTYTVTATNFNGCTATQTTSISVHALPTITVQSNSPQCAGQTINLTASGGTSYSWACPGGNCPNGFVSNFATPSFAGSASNSGTYTVTATNFNGCTATQTTSVSVHPLPTITVQSNSPQCAGQTINLTASGGTSYSWACPGGNCPNGFVSNFATPSFAGSASNSGIYTVTATNTNGCTATQTISVSVHALPTVTVTPPSPAQCGGSINLNTVFSSNGTLTYFTDSGFSSSATNPVTSTGPYYAKATLSACTSTASVSITIGVAPTINMAPPPVQCGGSINLNTVFSSNGTLAYFTDSGFSSSATNPVTSTGPYYAKASISTCTSTASVVITIGTAPTLTVTTPATVCPPNTVNLQAAASSNGTLSFYTDSGFSITVANPTAVGVGGIYYIKATNTANCSATASVSVSIGTHPDLPALTDLYNATNGPSWTNKTGWLSNCDPCGGWYGVTCKNGRVTSINLNNNQLGGTIPATLGNLSNLELLYLNNNQLSGTIPASLGNLGNLQKLWLFNNQLSGSIPATLGNLSALSSLYLNNNQLSGCFPASLSALCSHLSIYSFSGNAGLPGSGSNAAWQAFCATGKGSDAFIATASTSTPTVCVGNNISLSASGGTAYTWQGPNGYTSTNRTPTLNASASTFGGIYTVTVNNGGGACFKTATVQVTVNALPSVTLANNSPVCMGQVVSMSATGGTAYAWACPNGACPVGFVSTSATPSFTATSTQGEGHYSVTVNANGCTASAKLQLNLNPTPTATAETTTPTVCVGDNIRLQASGGATYSWACPSGTCGFESSTRNPVFVATNTTQSGIYTVTVANANGCTVTATVSVVVNALPMVLVSSNSPVCLGSTLQLSASGGSSYAWKGPVAFSSNVAQPTRSSITANMGGVYAVTVTNASGCSASGVTSVMVNTLPDASISSSTDKNYVCAGSTLGLAVPLQAGVTYKWYKGLDLLGNETANALVINGGDTYTAEVTNAQGCKATSSMSITALPALVLVASHSFIQNGATLKLSADPAGLKYSWSGPNGFTSTVRSPSISPISAANGGVYQLIGLAATSGCTATARTSVIIGATASRLGAETATEEATIQLRIFPNPTDGKFTVEVRLQVPSSIALQWIDALGQTKQSWHFGEVKAIHRVELDVSVYPEGIYLLSAETSDRKRIVKKVVKRN